MSDGMRLGEKHEFDHSVALRKPCLAHIVWIFLFIAFCAPSIAQTGETKQPRDITLGTPGEFPPYFLRDEKGRLSGFVVDLMDRIAEQSGFNMNYIVFKSGKEAQAKLLQGDVDIIGLGITNNRGIDDLAGRKVGVV
ncbi:MAG: transporter substrate-binding domain-containing protein [Pseudomonadota bacterium]|nr:transporter substrate-binding domain-containing protein [Pseudomonadota bacterium]